MSPFLLGITGFSFLIFFDICQIHSKKNLSVITSIIGYCCVLAALIFLIVTAKIRISSPYILVLGIIITALFFSLMIYSILIEIPLFSAYQSPGNRRTYRQGSYRIVRHPGFLWFFFMICALNFLFRSTNILPVSLSLVIMNFILIWAEDTFFFPAMFSDYTEYKKEVPFIIPKPGLFNSIPGDR